MPVSASWKENIIYYILWPSIRKDYHGIFGVDTYHTFMLLMPAASKYNLWTKHSLILHPLRISPVFQSVTLLVICVMVVFSHPSLVEIWPCPGYLEHLAQTKPHCFHPLLWSWTHLLNYFEYLSDCPLTACTVSHTVHSCWERTHSLLGILVIWGLYSYEKLVEVRDNGVISSRTFSNDFICMKSS